MKGEDMDIVWAVTSKTDSTAIVLLVVMTGGRYATERRHRL